MNIGIITEYKSLTLNYGNVLQTYALNSYIRAGYKDVNVETILIKHTSAATNWTKKIPPALLVRKVISKLKGKARTTSYGLTERREKFRAFAEKYIVTSDSMLTFKELPNAKYDIYIVGSDVVWSQYKYGYNRIKFLDFDMSKGNKKISYAASFGRNWIPKENRKDIKRCLDGFDAISVREKSSVNLLESIGVTNVDYVFDPIFLKSKDEWSEIECKPDGIEDEKYVFVYLLGEDDDKYKIVKEWCNCKKLKTIYIPYSAGIEDYSMKGDGDLGLTSCSPENWIWLVHNAEYVFTNSFHALAFATLFQRKFIAIERNGNNQSNRITDFLDTLGEHGKLIKLDRDIETIDRLEWNFEKIINKVDSQILHSKEFLEAALTFERLG